jgi:hypothetical protein
MSRGTPLYRLLNNGFWANSSPFDQLADIETCEAIPLYATKCV